MNTRWLKQHLVTIILMLVFVGLLSTTIYLARQAAARKDQIVTELDDQTLQLKGLRDHDPYPSSENIEILKRDHQRLGQLYGMLRQAAARETLSAADLQRPIEFSQRMRETLSALTALAEKQHVRTPDNFAFGFSRYVAEFPCRNPPAKPDECRKLLALLAKQLMVVEKLSTLVMSSGIEELTAVRRTEVEPGQASTDALAAAIRQDPKSLYAVLPFEIQFNCDTKSLRNFLNNLSQSDLFFAVRSLKSETTTLTSSTGGNPTPSLEPGQLTTAEPVRVVERRRLTVTLRIDLIEFSSPLEKIKGRT